MVESRFVGFDNSYFIQLFFFFRRFIDNVAQLVSFVTQNGSPIEGAFDIHQLWSDDMTFSKAGNVLCGKPFPRNNNIRFVDRVFYQEDFNGANQDELDVMPSKYDLS